jgi:NRPS condensation-like uncharacterized protein
MLRLRYILYEPEGLKFLKVNIAVFKKMAHTEYLLTVISTNVKNMSESVKTFHPCSRNDCVLFGIWAAGRTDGGKSEAHGGVLRCA